MSTSLHEHDTLYIGGDWLPAAGTARLEVINPFTHESLGYVPRGTAEDVERAVAAAEAALPSWSAAEMKDRIQALRRLEAALEPRREELAGLITGEVGTPIKISRRLQVGLPLTTVRNTADIAEGLEPEEIVGNSAITRVPVGVVGAITPWNYPLHQIMAKVAPALAAGCTVVLKPSELAPLSAFLLAEAIAEADLPPGVFNLVSGDAEVGRSLVSHSGVAMISFTGSTATGTRIAAAAASRMARVTLELGGKSASVVLDDADLERAVRTTVRSCFLNAGQTCNALTRLLVPGTREDEAVQIAVETAARFRLGDPLDEATTMGPLISEGQRQRVLSSIQKARAEGVPLAMGGGTPDRPNGYFVEPTIFHRVDPRASIAQEEIFGPVLTVIPYTTEDDAVQVANGTPYGLAAAVWSASTERALGVARRLRAGQVDVNGAAFNPLAPFGGFGFSGVGREFGRHGLEEFFELRSIQC